MRAFFAVLLAAGMQYASAAEQEIRIGVLSFRPLEQTRQQWQATADYLNAHVAGGYHFSMEPVYFPELNGVIDQNRFHFVLTNPEHYVTMRTEHGLTAMATLMPLAEGHPVDSFGGVILVRADRNDIKGLEDLRGKVVAAVGEQSFGAYLVQRWAMYERGIQIGEVNKVHFTGLPQDKVVAEVLNGQADVGFVRTGLVESMVREGKLKLGDIKILNAQPRRDFPQLLSTELYPEWAFSAAPNVPEKLVKKVTLALLNITPDDAAARSGNYYGFTPPGNYAAVEAVMLRLKMNPDLAQQFDLRDVVRKYGMPLLGGALLLLLGVLSALVYLARTNRSLQSSYRERKRLDDELQRTNASLEEKVIKRTQDLQQSEARFRQMFEHHASPMLLVEPLSGDIVNANRAAARFYGYSIAQMKAMNIAQISTSPPQEVAEQRLQAQNQERNYFVFPHRLANGEERTVEVHSSPVEVEGRRLLFSIIHDITERKQLEEQMHDLAFYDPLTKLPNRRLLLDRLGKALLTCARTRRYGALMFLDLDYFKKINDLHGHDIGDKLLVEVANRILACIREQDSAARFGGDEFVVMLEGLSESQIEAVTQAEVVAEKIRSALAQPYSLKQENEVIVHHCSSSIGVSVFRRHDETMEQLLKWTDMAMYRAKDSGRNAIRFFDPDMQTAIENRAALEADLHAALEQHQFSLFYQVQVNAAGKPQGAEVLLRWQHPQRGLVLPAQFIPLAEETGLIVPIGAWVMDTACAQIKRWRDRPAFQNLVLAVNVSAKQFRQPDFAEQVQKAVVRHGITAMSLKLELTETLVLDNIDDTVTKMQALKDFGVSFSMDDFGTGYSSLSYLKRLPLDQIKIDQSFVRNISTDKADMVMVMTMVDLGMNFEVDVIAEGVETETQFQLLHRYGCASFQGNLFGRPLPLEQFEQQLNAKHTP
jgi:diguanylate cyclase (GGDEF)-like protein/PAS domain S-box-containing protein